MIAVWMMYCVALGILLAGAALMLERAVAAVGGATRRVWALALSGSILVPALAILLQSEGTMGSGAEAGAVSETIRAGMESSVAVFSILDGVLVTAWIVMSGFLVVALMAMGARSWRAHRSWRRAQVDGVPVLVSQSVGPAVVGFLQGRVVLPEWALRSDASQRAVMLRHEMEHLAGGDPQLLLFTLVLVAAMPWNPALWFMMYRLRMAVEVDCDVRVLRDRTVDRRSYGELLLAVGARRSPRALTVAGLARPRSLLEHRIDSMTRPRGRRALRRSALLALGAATVVMAAWSLPQPVRPTAFDLAADACVEEGPPPAAIPG